MSGPSPRPPLDPQAARFLEKLRAARLPPIDQIPIREARALSASTVVTADEVGSVETLPIDGGDSELQVRLYRPPEGTPPHEAGASIVFFHGGGWVLGSIDSHDGLCRRLCRLSRCTVISVDYRLAPEHPFPAAIRDAERAVRWASGTQRPFRLIQAASPSAAIVPGPTSHRRCPTCDGGDRPPGPDSVVSRDRDWPGYAVVP